MAYNASNVGMSKWVRKVRKAVGPQASDWKHNEEGSIEGLPLYFLVSAVIVAVAMFVPKREMIEIVLSLIQDRPLLFIVEIFGLIAGLAMVLGHTVWSKGFLAFVVTLIGWITLIRSIVLLFLPAEAVGRFVKTIRYEQNYYLFAAIALVVGAYLAFAGFAR